MKREEKIADLVQRWIPDELRLDERHDAKLVSSAITAVIMAVYDSDRMTMVGQSGEVNAALKTWFDTTFSEHMRAEDDHMKGLEEKASRAMPVVDIGDERNRKRYGGGWRGYVASDTRYESGNSLVWKKDGDVYSAEYVVNQTDDNPDGTTYAGTGDSAFSAMENAVRNSGAMLRPFKPFEGVTV